MKWLKICDRIFNPEHIMLIAPEGEQSVTVYLRDGKSSTVHGETIDQVEKGIREDE